ncbi:SET domain protein [Aspergillus luchuensis]|uniref:SET domain protein n=1 Tax=Aspergillus kawachii TaxID=1069201 RepID=A0A146F0U5_ASPKA|nr:SET domain protein [Aspergillus luchuensis IFO 4308]GAT19857.1 SET domain protein [Aspergillus luchuensis]
MAAKRVSDNGPKDTSSSRTRSLRKRTQEEGGDADRSPSKRPKRSSPAPSRTLRSQTQRGQEGEDEDISPSKQSETIPPTPSETSESQEGQGQEGGEAGSSPSKRGITTLHTPSQPLQSQEEQRQEGGEDTESSFRNRPNASFPAPAQLSGSQTKRRQEGEDAENTPNKRLKMGTFQPRPLSPAFILDRDQILHAFMYDLYEVNKIHNESENNKVARLDYEARCIYASRALEKALTCTLWSFDEANMDCEEREASRLRIFAENFGWPMLAICVQAEAFRRLCKEESTLMWKAVYRKFQEHNYNIWIQASTRGFEWRKLLAPYAGDAAPPKLNHVLASRNEAENLRHTHPHEIVIKEEERQVRSPKFQNRLQKHIEASIFHPRDWQTAKDPEHRGLKKDPTLREGLNYGLCDLCAEGKICECRIKEAPFEFVQLVETPKGVGVRALTRFEKGDILGEYIGELHPPCYQGDLIYALTMQGKVDVDEEIALICPMEYGNFTRFINHSCRPNTTFERRTIGNRATMTVEVVRNIQPFEELTINYGREYWKGRTCICGEEGCYTQQERRKKRQQEREMERRKQRDMQLEASKNVAEEVDKDKEECLAKEVNEEEAEAAAAAAEEEQTDEEEADEEETDEEETDEEETEEEEAGEEEVEERPPNKKPEEAKASSRKWSKGGSSLEAEEGPSKIAMKKKKEEEKRKEKKNWKEKEQKNNKKHRKNRHQ